MEYVTTGDFYYALALVGFAILVGIALILNWIFCTRSTYNELTNWQLPPEIKDVN